MVTKMTNVRKNEYIPPNSNQRDIKKKNIDDKISNIIATIIFVIFIINLYSGLESVFMIPHSLISQGGKIFVAAVILINIMSLINRINLRIILLLFFTTFVIGFNLVFFPENQSVFIGISTTFVTMCLPIMVCIYAIKDVGILYVKLNRISYLIAVIVLFSLIGFNLFGFSFNNNEYAMGFGAAIMLPTCFLIVDALNKKKLAIILAFANIIAIVFYGSRGPLLSIGLWIFLYLYQSVLSKNINKKTKIRYSILIFTGILTLTFLYFDGFNLIYQFLESRGVYSRTLYLFANNFGHLSNRDIIYSYFWEAIKASPFTIRGIGADRVALNAYPHNIIIELL